MRVQSITNDHQRPAHPSAPTGAGSRDRKGATVWAFEDLKNPYAADRLPNGNTLVTLRNKGVVVEVDREGKVVWELTGLSSPSDADRLPNGHTIVAENTRVREFDRRGTEVWKKDMTWAVEVNRY